MGGLTVELVTVSDINKSNTDMKGLEFSTYAIYVGERYF